MGDPIVQHTLTIVAKVGDLDRSRRAVGDVGRPREPVAPGAPAQPALFRAPDLPVHFGRVVFIDEPAESPYSSWLVLESNFDSGERDRGRAIREHLDALVSCRDRELCELFSGCVGFDEPGDLRSALDECLVDSTAEYQGHIGRSLGRIELEAAVHDAALDIASTLPERTGPEEARDAIARELRRLAGAPGSPLAGLDLAAPPPAFPDPVERERKLQQTWGPWIENALRVFGGGRAGLGAAVALGLSPVWLPWLGYAVLRADMGPEFDFQYEAEHRSAEAAERLARVHETEDHGMQNALTHLVPLKQGLAGSTTLRFFHRYIALMAKNYFNQVEQLGGIPSIHFAKWLLIDEGQRLLFLSNYDGSWESYLGDFVDQAAIGLNLAWSLTEGYPKTYALFSRGGAYDEERFKAWARAHQQPTPIFYSAYPTHSLSAINNNTWLRYGLHDGVPVDEEWRRRLT